MATIRRAPRDLDPIDLAAVSQQRRIFPTLGAVGISVSARLATGTWASRTMELKRRVGGRSDSFPTPKTIPAGGGTAQASAEDLAGVEELELVTVGSAEAGTMNRAQATVTYETEEETVGLLSGFGGAGVGLGVGVGVGVVRGSGESETQRLDAPPLD